MAELWDRDRAPRLLFVEDDRDTGSMFRICFGPWADITLAGGTEEALQLLSAQPFDLLIVDLDLRSQDVYELIRSIRSSGSQVPAIFLTHRAHPDDRLQEFEIEADDYFGKPIDLDAVESRIRSILGRLAGDTTAAAPRPEVKKK